jgi:anti-anti-sigma factor
MEPDPARDGRTPPPGVTVVRLPAEVDLGVGAQVRDDLFAGLARGADLVVDARGVAFMDSTGVNALIRARERAELMSGSIHVVSGARHVRRLLEITRLTEVLHLVGTLDEAFDCLCSNRSEHSCKPPSDAVPPSTPPPG